MKKILDFIRAHKILSAIGAVIIIVIIYFVFKGDRNQVYTTAVAKRNNIVQEVSVSGRVKAAQAVDLAFEKPGRINQVLADIGDHITKGQVLVRLDNSELSSQLTKAEADLESQEASLKQAQITLSNYYGDVANISSDAYTKANNSIRRQTDVFFTDDETTPQLVFSVYNSKETPYNSAEVDTESQRFILSGELNKWKNELVQLGSGFGTSQDVLDQALISAQNRLISTQTFLDRLMDAVVNSVGLTQTSVDTYKDNLNTARTNVVSALSAVVNLKQNISSQKAAIATSEANTKAFKASIENIKTQLAKTALYSPINGVVTKQNAEVGELAVSGAIMVSIISNAAFEIEANIPEVDIAKIKIGNTTNVTLDAYGNDIVFKAVVVKIEPAETLIEGVATYKTTFQFMSENEIIKPGMTANLDILAEKKENVIVISQRTIKINGEKTVRILENGIPKEVVIETGLRGSDGNIEIISGVKEGDLIIISEK